MAWICGERIIFAQEMAIFSFYNNISGEIFRPSKANIGLK